MLRGVDFAREARKQVQIQDILLLQAADVQEAADKAGLPLYMPRIDLCTDNGAMIASAAYYHWKRGETAPLTLNAVPNLRLV